MMNTSLQNKLRRASIWKVTLLAFLPVFIGILWILSSFNMIGKSRVNKMEARVAQKDSTLRALLPEHRSLLEGNKEMGGLLDAFTKMDAFIAEQKAHFLTFGPSQRTQLMTDIERTNSDYEERIGCIRRLPLQDSLALCYRKLNLEHYALLWWQARQDVLSEEEKIKMLETEVAAKEEQIFDLRSKVLDEKKKSPGAGALTYGTGPSADTGSVTAAEIAELQQELKSTRDYIKNLKAQSWQKRLAEKKATVDQLQQIVDNKKRLNSIVPGVRDLIRRINQDIETMEMNPEGT